MVFTPAGIELIAMRFSRILVSEVVHRSCQWSVLATLLGTADRRVRGDVASAAARASKAFGLVFKGVFAKNSEMRYHPRSRSW